MITVEQIVKLIEDNVSTTIARDEDDYPTVVHTNFIQPAEAIYKAIQAERPEMNIPTVDELTALIWGTDAQKIAERVHEILLKYNPPATTPPAVNAGPVSYDIQPPRVSDEELAEIYRDGWNTADYGPGRLLAGVRAVRAAVEASLLAEIERLKEAHYGTLKNWNDMRKNRDDIREERDALNAEVERMTNAYTGALEERDSLREKLEKAEKERDDWRSQAEAAFQRYDKAERTLSKAGYTDAGGELWKPPIGKPQRTVPARVTFDCTAEDLGNYMLEATRWNATSREWQTAMDYLSTRARARIAVPDGVPTAEEIGRALCEGWQNVDTWEDLDEEQKSNYTKEGQAALDCLSPFLAAPVDPTLCETPLILNEAIQGLFFSQEKQWHYRLLDTSNPADTARASLWLASLAAKRGEDVRVPQWISEGKAWATEAGILSELPRQPIKCIFCDFKADTLASLREHSAYCEKHPLWRQPQATPETLEQLAEIGRLDMLNDGGTYLSWGALNTEEKARCIRFVSALTAVRQHAAAVAELDAVIKEVCDGTR